jgi:predicted AAA+ superfamily ATPase
MLVQVCESMADPQTRKREITALAEAMAELKLPEGTIVTRGEEEQIRVESGKIDVVPAWRFLLQLTEIT